LGLGAELGVLGAGGAGGAGGGSFPIKGKVVELTPWKDVVDVTKEVEAAGVVLEASRLLDTARAAL
jgi:hypothetical protein